MTTLDADVQWTWRCVEVKLKVAVSVAAGMVLIGGGNAGEVVHMQYEDGA